MTFKSTLNSILNPFKPWVFSEVLSLEQSACVILSGDLAVSKTGIILVELLHGGGLLESISCDDYVISGNESNILGFELVALRHIQQLTEFQARQICSYQVGDQKFIPGVNRLFSGPVIVAVL